MHIIYFIGRLSSLLMLTFNQPLIQVSRASVTFFKDEMGLRDDDIQHVLSDAIKFYNKSYGLDFSGSQPNEQNEYFLENANCIVSTKTFAIRWSSTIGFKLETLVQHVMK